MNLALKGRDIVGAPATARHGINRVQLSHPFKVQMGYFDQAPGRCPGLVCDAPLGRRYCDDSGAFHLLCAEQISALRQIEHGAQAGYSSRLSDVFDRCLPVQERIRYFPFYYNYLRFNYLFCDRARMISPTRIVVG